MRRGTLHLVRRPLHASNCGTPQRYSHQQGQQGKELQREHMVQAAADRPYCLQLQVSADWAFYAASWNATIGKYSRSNIRWPIWLDFSSLSIVSQQAELEWMRRMRWEPHLLLGALACSSDATAIMLPCGACALLSLQNLRSIFCFMQTG